MCGVVLQVIGFVQEHQCEVASLKASLSDVRLGRKRDVKELQRKLGYSAMLLFLVHTSCIFFCFSMSICKRMSLHSVCPSVRVFLFFCHCLYV